ncbi:MAG: lysylphosphatidylglycerol synthase transmembrane domain-containing protein [Planctomycetota bacterium]
MKKALGLVLKLAVTGFLLFMVIRQIPWRDKAYLLTTQSVDLGTVISPENDAVRYVNSKGKPALAYLNRPVDLGEGSMGWIQAVEFTPDAPLKAIKLDIMEGDLIKDSGDQVTFKVDNKEVILSSDRLAGGVDLGIEPGFPTLFARMQPWYFIAGFLLISVSQIVPAFRWSGLLKVHGLNLGAWDSLRLVFMGYFFSQIMPGTSGGDVVRAVFVAKKSSDRAAAALSVFVDRAVGLFGIAIIGSIAVLLQWENPLIQHHGQKMVALVTTFIVGSCIYFSRTLRKWTGFEWLMGVLPMGRQLREWEQKIFVYGHHKKAVFNAFILTGVIQINFIFVNYFLARSLGLEEGNLGKFFVFMPVITVLIALPVSFAGFGLREYLFVHFFMAMGMKGGVGFATALTQGISMLLWSLLGWLAFISLKKDGKSISGGFFKDSPVQETELAMNSGKLRIEP